MARRHITPPSERIITDYEDTNGGHVYEANYREGLIVGPDGNQVYEKRATNRAMIGGEFFHPGLASGPKPILLPGLCEVCRRRHRQHPPLTNVKHLKLCAGRGCGIPCCPRHRIQSRLDHQWRCRRCHRRHAVARFFMACLRLIFFQRVDT